MNSYKKLDLEKECILPSDIEEAAKTFPKFQFQHFKPQRVFLTGSTGFLGAYLLYELLKDPNREVFCLVRCQNSSEARTRIEEILNIYDLARQVDLSRVRFIPGDLSKPLLGLSQQEYAKLASTIDYCIHCGALHQAGDYFSLKSANVLGTLEMLRFACQQKLKPLHYISSIAITDIGEYPKGYVIDEMSPLNFNDKGSGYQQTKWVADQISIKAQQLGLPISVYRIGSIVGDHKRGIGKTSLGGNIIIRFLRISVKIRLFPLTNLFLDFTPVDTVAKTIVSAADTSNTLGKIFYLFSPQINLDSCLPWIQSFGYTIEPVSFSSWVEKVIEKKESLEDSEEDPIIPMILGDVEHGQESHIESYIKRPEISNSKTLSILSHLAIEFPETDESFLHRLFDHFVQTGFLPPPPKL